jgi:hypothetical protein
MLNRFNRLSLISVCAFITTLGLGMAAQPGLANCNDVIAPVEEVQADMEARWNQVQSRESYPWGDLQPYGTLEGDRITMTADFDQLPGYEKQRALDAIFRPDLLDLTTAEWQDLLDGYYIGAGMGSPYEAYDSDGRLLGVSYDGCTRYTLLTERSRYGWFFNVRFRYPGMTVEGLRNTGQPFWREVNTSISEADEFATRYAFWQAVEFPHYNEGWWIAWVPEQGAFEVNLPVDYDPEMLDRVLNNLPTIYPYRVITTDGTFVMETTPQFPQ